MKQKFYFPILMILLSLVSAAQAQTKYPIEILTCKNGTGPMIEGFKIVATSAKTTTISFKSMDDYAKPVEIVASTNAYNYSFKGLYQKENTSLLTINAQNGKSTTASIVTVSPADLKAEPGQVSSMFSEHFDCN